MFLDVFSVFLKLCSFGKDYKDIEVEHFLPDV